MTIILRAIAITIALALSANVAMAENITIVAAASIKNAMADIVSKFNAEHHNDYVKVIYGSSGKFTAQIRNGAPFDMLFAADVHFPKALKKEGLTSSDPVIYAIGRLAIWSSTTDATRLTLQKLSDPNIRKIAIANPDVAPYGMRAKEALKSAGMWEKLQTKLVFGENIEHAAQMAITGTADAGIIALSLARSLALSKRGTYSLIDDRLHESLAQAFVITKRAKDSALAQRFSSYVQEPGARKIMQGYGFVLPEKL